MNYDSIPNDSTIELTTKALADRNIEAIVVATKEEALQKVIELIPQGASVNNGSSRTLEEIGLVEYLKSDTHGWNNLHASVVAESDPAKKQELRNASLFAEYYLGSVHALAQSGELVIASASGSQLPPIVFTSKNIIFVVGAQKIMPTHAEAMQRIREYVVPLEDVRMKEVGMGGTVLSKVLTIECEPAFMGRKVMVIIVKEKLGF